MLNFAIQTARDAGRESKQKVMDETSKARGETSAARLRIIGVLLRVSSWQGRARTIQHPTINASVKSAAASSVLVDVEAYSAAGQKVFQSYADNQSFTAGQTRTYAIPWQVPSTTAAGGRVPG